MDKTIKTHVRVFFHKEDLKEVISMIQLLGIKKYRISSYGCNAKDIFKIVFTEGDFMYTYPLYTNA